MNILRSIKWENIKENLIVLLNRASEITLHPVDQGFEAEVWKLRADGEWYVLKVWNKNGNPDVGYQYRLLDVLQSRRIPVSTPYGWGRDREGNQVMLTTDDGESLFTCTAEDMIEMAKILSLIHGLSVYDLQQVQIPRYDFIHYFFPEVQQHPDIFMLLQSVTQRGQLNQSHLIHGDYHLHNIVQKDNRFTVIDWTNAQWGDARYDFAWTFLLLHLYVSEQDADAFRTTYLTERKVGNLAQFEALACLRWVFLFRHEGVPILPGTKEKVAAFIENNPYLKGKPLVA
ncbi:Ser/Thr protein kinase RdoA (MazF antagonist) [Sporosarcina luteola]|nr:Ser/Thr protein kinase RdoA (MazF antagonist) [Sporosarcina luteola]